MCDMCYTRFVFLATSCTCKVTPNLSASCLTGCPSSFHSSRFGSHAPDAETVKRVIKFTNTSPVGKTHKLVNENTVEPL